MKEYFDKELVERERILSSEKNWEVHRIRKMSPEEESASYSSMRPKSRAWERRKALNENLNPLVSFLRSSIGKKWDEIYSEICSINKKNSAVGAHIFQHIEWYVELNPSFVDGVPHYGYNSGSTAKLYNHFYVHKGILRRAERRKKKKEEKDICVYNIDKFNFLVRNRKGIWYNFIYSDQFTIVDVYHPDKYGSEGQLLLSSYTSHEKIYKFPRAYASDRDFCLMPKVDECLYLTKVFQSSKKTKRRYRL